MLGPLTAPTGIASTPRLTTMLQEPLRVLVTGANGFVGREMVRVLLDRGWAVVAGVRDGNVAMPDGVAKRVLGDLSEYHSGMDLAGLDAVVHLAAEVREANSEGFRDDILSADADAALALAASAVASGVATLVFLSTVRVSGEPTNFTRPLRADDPVRPQDPFAVSKARAEAQLLKPQIAEQMRVCVVRSPLVYGPGGGANCAPLARFAGSALPVPSGFNANRCSLVSLSNLVSAVLLMLEDERAEGVYMVRDGIDMSTADLIRRVRRITGRLDVRLPVSAAVLDRAARPCGQDLIAKDLLGSLTVDDTPIRRDLGWVPAETVEQGLWRWVVGGVRPRRLMMFITEDWYFCSHRLPVAIAAQEAGWEVHLICNVRDHAQIIRSAGVHLHPLELDRGGRDPRSELRTLCQLERIVREVRPDLIHNVAIKPVIYGSVVARRCGVPATVNALAGLGSTFSDQSVGWLGRGLVKVLSRVLGRRDQWMIVQNRDDAAFVTERRLVGEGRLRFIPGSGVDTSVFAPCEPPESERNVVATVVSRMLWDKGIGETVEAARLLKEWGSPVSVHLVGDPDPHNRRSIDRSQLERWHEEEIITWHGRREDIAEVWRSSDIAVLASYREGMPKSLLEAASVGRPMVACDVPGCRELVTDHVTGRLVPARDGRALAMAIDELATQPLVRRRMGRRARESVMSRYSVQHVVDAHVDVYAAACGLSMGGLTRDLRP